MDRKPPFYVRVEWYTGDVTIEKVIEETKDLYYFDKSLNASNWAVKQWCTVVEGPQKWVFKVLEGLPPSEIDFRDFNAMKVFSAHLSALYPDIVTTYDKVEDL